MTVCNMAIEGGARAGMIAVDDATVEYFAGRPYAPAGELWELRLPPGPISGAMMTPPLTGWLHSMAPPWFPR